MAYKIHIANFGQSYGGLSTVGYTLYNIDGTVKRARTTDGVVEYGTSTGIYGANIDYSQFDQLIVMWDTGGGTPRYSVEENRTILGAIQDETDHVRIIWNSLRNQGSIYEKLLRKINDLEDAGIKDHSADLKDLKDMLVDIKGREEISLKDIQKALNIEVTPPVVNLPAPQVTINEKEIKIPDYAPELTKIKGQISALQSQVASLPKKNNDYAADFNKIMSSLAAIVKMIPSESSAAIKEICDDIYKLESSIGVKLADHGEAIKAHNPKLEQIGGNMKALKDAMDSLIKIIPPAHLFLVLQSSMKYLKDEEKKANMVRMRAALRVK